MAIVTQSDTTDDAVNRFRGSMDKLLALDIAGRYTERLKEIDALRYPTRRSISCMHAKLFL